jgi:uncharacterized protein (DUF1778 family)
MDRIVRIVLNKCDSKRMLALLENPLKPTAALKVASRHRVARK